MTKYINYFKIHWTFSIVQLSLYLFSNLFTIKINKNWPIKLVLNFNNRDKENLEHFEFKGNEKEKNFKRKPGKNKLKILQKNYLENKFPEEQSHANKEFKK